MRVAHWPMKLDAAIEAARHKPFKWGEHDCCLFAASVVFELTGMDFGKSYRGIYSDARQALIILGDAGGVEAIATRCLGKPIDKAQAQRGDVVLLNCGVGRRASLGICVGVAVASPGKDGIAFLPMQNWVKAWRV